MNDSIPDLKIELMDDDHGEGLILLEQDNCGNVDAGFLSSGAGLCIWASCLQIAYKRQKTKKPTIELIAGFLYCTWGG